MTTNRHPNPALGANATGYANGSRVTGLSGFERATGVVGDAAGSYITGPRFPVTPGESLLYSVTMRRPTAGGVQLFVDYYATAGSPTSVGDVGGNFNVVTSDALTPSR